MEIKKQVCSLELAKRLKKLGVNQESYFVWERVQKEPFDNGWTDWKVVASWEAIGFELGGEHIAAFTVAELGELLPQGFHSTRPNGYQWVCFTDKHDEGQTGKTEADCLAHMLIRLLEQKFLNSPEAAR